MNEPAIHLEGLSKTFPGGVVAVDRVDLDISRGTVYGLIGRNGAGKTTMLRLMMGLLRPTEGMVSVLGSSLWTAPRELRARVASVQRVRSAYDNEKSSA